jgi:hypothetical protein
MSGLLNANVYQNKTRITDDHKKSICQIAAILSDMLQLVLASSDHRVQLSMDVVVRPLSATYVITIDA